MKQSIRKSTPFVSDSSNPAPGAALATIRREKAIDGALIRRHLGLTNQMFQALEADDYRQLPSPLYVKGYLRRYAELLKVRPAPVLACYQQFLENHQLVPVSTPEPVTFRPFKAMVGSTVAFLLGTSLVFGISDGESTISETFSSESFQQALPTPPEQQLPTAGDENQLRLEFVDVSWVEVIDASDHVLAVSLQRAGSQLELEGTQPFHVKLGNGPAAVITYLGDVVSFEHDPETLAAELTLGK